MNEFQTGGYGAGISGQQYAPQGFFGSMLGAPLGGLIGRGIGGLLGNQQLGGQIGNWAGGIGGTLLPFGADPVSAAYQQQQQQQQQQLQQIQQLQQLQQLQQQQQQQQQLSPQGWFGNLIGSVAQPIGSAVGGLFGQSGIGSTIGGMAGQLGRLLPFGADPTSIVQAHQAQNQVLQQHVQQLQQQLQQIQQQYSQLVQSLSQQAGQGQIAPQGWFGNLIGQIGQPLGSAIGSAFGNASLGSSIGGVASQLGRMLPFGSDPVSQAYLQQAQLAQQQAQLGQGNTYYPSQGMQYSQQPTLH